MANWRDRTNDDAALTGSRHDLDSMRNQYSAQTRPETKSPALPPPSVDPNIFLRRLAFAQGLCIFGLAAYVLFTSLATTTKIATAVASAVAKEQEAAEERTKDAVEQAVAKEQKAAEKRTKDAVEQAVAEERIAAEKRTKDAVDKAVAEARRAAEKRIQGDKEAVDKGKSNRSNSN